MSLLAAVLTKSCSRKRASVSGESVASLEECGYNLVKGVAVKLVMKIRGMKRRQTTELNKVVHIPFLYGVSQNLMSTARKFNVKVVSTTNFMLSKLTPFVGGVKKKHRCLS